MKRFDEPLAVLAHSVPLLAAGMRTALADAGWTRVSVLDPAEGFVEQVLAQAPDVLVIDHDITGPGTGVDVCALVRASHSPTQCIMVVNRSSSPDLTGIARSGAVGVLSAGVSAPEFVGACNAALHGGSAVSSEMAALLLSAVGASQKRTTTSSLTRREAEVLALAAEGLTNQDIADRLFLSQNTVKNHLRRIYEKLQVSSRTEAVMRAVREGTLLPGAS